MKQERRREVRGRRGRRGGAGEAADGWGKLESETFLPVRFWRVSLSLVFTCRYNQTTSSLTCVCVRLYQSACTRSQGRVSSWGNLIFPSLGLYWFPLWFFFLIVCCHKPVEVGVPLHQRDTLEAFSCVHHSCTRTEVRDSPWTSSFYFAMAVTTNLPLGQENMNLNYFW